jgi:hypothetical protein
MAATPEDGGEHKEKSELDRFRDLARKLVRVPKHEIDAEQAKEKERNDRDEQR